MMNRRKNLPISVMNGLVFAAALTLPPVSAATVSPPDSGRVACYANPPVSPGSAKYGVTAGGRDVFVYHTSAGDFAAFSLEGSARVEIETSAPAGNVRVVPARHSIVPALDGNRIRFTLPRPAHLLVEVDGVQDLFLFADAPDPDPPAPDGPSRPGSRGTARWSPCSPSRPAPGNTNGSTS
jgi:hypothetical protein